MGFFQRVKLLDMERVGEGEYVISGTLRDSVHDIALIITVTMPDKVIQSAEARISSGPYTEICRMITDRAKRLVGVRIAPGFTRRAAELIGGPDGCSHLVDLAVDLARMAYQLDFTVLIEEEPILTDLKGHYKERREITMKHLPRIKDSCWVFKEGNEPLFEE